MPIRRIIETRIQRSADAVFSILTDLHHYGAWLPRSPVFRGTSAISPGPIGPGTTYCEASPWGTRRGRIIDWQPPTRILYRQPMALRPAWLGAIQIEVEDMLFPCGAGVLLRRTLDLRFDGPIAHLAGIVVSLFAIEIRRTQSRLKAFAERGGIADPQTR